VHPANVSTATGTTRVVAKNRLYLLSANDSVLNDIVSGL
jgi:hypothetical protein